MIILKANQNGTFDGVLASDLGKETVVLTSYIDRVAFIFEEGESQAELKETILRAADVVRKEQTSCRMTWPTPQSIKAWESRHPEAVGTLQPK
jgi:hypothetical protein